MSTNWMPLAFVIYGGVVTIILTITALWMDWSHRREPKSKYTAAAVSQTEET